MSIKDAVKINSKCFFTYEIKDSQGDGTGIYRLQEQAIQSRTMLGNQYTPANTVVLRYTDFKELAKELKKDVKIVFNEADLTEDLKDKLKEEDIEDKIIKDIASIDGITR